ncbi:transmembrane protein 256 homolog [Megachile rotundata]|uniref:transmembrane protein 256 homolog n=1 Tax=Megachile rotundata TaxID=143995 RepID=UPI000258ED74|nr:PREDICTED: transmembrane protein 256 homolog [Megachile rotundata]
MQSVLNYALSGAQLSLDAATGAVKFVTRTNSKPKVEATMSPLWKLASAAGPFTKIAALSGASAVVINAYGAHTPHLKDEKLIKIFDTASRYHLVHSLVILALPLCRSPYLTCTFMLSGMILFSGSCYYYALTGDKRYNKVTPFGGVCYILGWLSMLI